jgi:hypothetical protein
MKTSHEISRLDDVTHQQVSYLPSQSLTRESQISKRIMFNLRLPSL